MSSITPARVRRHEPSSCDDLVIENVRRYLAGEPLLNLVDPERGY